MSNQDRFTVINNATGADAGRQQVTLGRAFAFVDQSVLAKLGMSWVTRLMGEKPSGIPHIISLLGPETVELTGISIEPLELKKLALRVAVSDKNLYRAERDAISIFLLNPLYPESETIVLLAQSDGTVFSRHRVRLGKHGEGQLRLSDLPVGEYGVIFEGDKEPACEFEVAQYRLVPLVASLANSQVTKDGDLQVTLQVESFGIPVTGEVRLDLLDKNNRIKSVSTQANSGQICASFHLTGAGPHSIAIQLCSDLTKTATVPLRGSREAERKNTVFSALGAEVVGSLLPIGSSKPVRGIYLEEGAWTTSPVALDRVDAGQASFTINTPVQALRIVLVDPTSPKPRANAVNTNVAQHPRQFDDQFRKAETRLKNGQLAQACKLFETQRLAYENPHPAYAYKAACCYAKSQQLEKAIVCLKQAISDGWRDYNQMRTDSDLASLSDYEPFIELMEAGIQEHVFFNLAAGEKLEVPVASPVAIAVIGACIYGKPWEGWAAVVTPSTVTTEIMVPDNCEAGGEIKIDFQTNKKNASVYAIVKDARLISADTPELKLAADLKSFVESASKELVVDYPTANLHSATTAGLMGQLVRNRMSRGIESEQMETFGMTGSWGAASMTLADSIRGRILEPEPQQQPMSWGSSSSSLAAPQSSAAPPAPAGGAGRSIGMFGISNQEIDAVFSKSLGMKARTTTPQRVKASEPEAQTKTARETVLIDSPEVLFAGFIPMENGSGTLSLQLPDQFANYLVECFAISGFDWASKEVSFKAARDPFIQLVTPMFARKTDKCPGKIYVGATREVTVRLLHDGKEVELTGNQSQGVTGMDLMFVFPAEPGFYEAILEREGKEVARHEKRVNEPGKLKRLVRTLQLVESGDSLSLADDPGYNNILVMPGIEKSFNILVEATADYWHCCCEQTSAKILAGCAMYMFAKDDSRRKKAETVIVAGVRREKEMWLPGRGFKSYPHVGNQPDTYVGPRAARNLRNLSFLAEHPNLSADLASAIKEGLEMAEDTGKAYNLPWPPRQINSNEDVYSTVRFGDGSNAAKALTIAEKYASSFDAASLQRTPLIGRSVLSRSECAYAAATLLRAGGTGHLQSALALANHVLSQFEGEGRLYSTFDSVAAIALMSELHHSGITTSGGDLEVNGINRTVRDAIAMTEKIHTVTVKKGVATLAVDKFVEEDWNAFGAQVQLKVSLEKGGKQTRVLKASDSVDLVVTLDGDYKMGDLLWVALPDALSRVVGGGQVKLFSVDFKGQKEIRLALAATGTTEDIQGQAQQQGLSICVRNMFDEERNGCPGLIPITVTR